MATLIHMPEVSANTPSAVIVAWTKKEGEKVSVGDCLAEIETDKAIIEFAADNEGVLGKILIEAGSDVKVGTPIAVLLNHDEKNIDVNALLSEVPSIAPDTAGDTSQSPVMSDSVNQDLPVVSSSSRIFASPLARRLAKQNDIDLSTVKGTGPNGRVVKNDIQRVLETNRMAPTMRNVAVPDHEVYTDIPHSSMRKAIARRMLESKNTIPHFYVKVDCRMDALLALRANVNQHAERKISVNDLLTKIVAYALHQYPQVNVSWSDEGLRQYHHSDIAIAVSTDRGLITPIVKSAEQKSVSAISQEIADLATRARDGKLQPSEYQGGTFTISNLGMFGIQEFSAIINPPQAAILAVGATEDRVIVEDKQMVIASMMSVTLSVDHRAIDGSVAAEWLMQLKKLIENPLRALI